MPDVKKMFCWRERYVFSACFMNIRWFFFLVRHEAGTKWPPFSMSRGVHCSCKLSPQRHIFMPHTASCALAWVTSSICPMRTHDWACPHVTSRSMFHSVRYRPFMATIERIVLCNKANNLNSSSGILDQKCTRYRIFWGKWMGYLDQNGISGRKSLSFVIGINGIRAI